MTGVGSSPALATCETSQVLLEGLSCGFPGVLPFRPTYRLARLDMSEIILIGTLNLIKKNESLKIFIFSLSLNKTEEIFISAVSYLFCICENKDADQLRSSRATAQRSTKIVQSLFFLNPKIQTSNHYLWVYNPVCVGDGRKLRRQVLS